MTLLQKTFVACPLYLQVIHINTCTYKQGCSCISYFCSTTHRRPGAAVDRHRKRCHMLFSGKTQYLYLVLVCHAEPLYIIIMHRYIWLAPTLLLYATVLLHYEVWYILFTHDNCVIVNISLHTHRDTLISAAPENITMLREKVFRSDMSAIKRAKAYDLL